jgi:hypothetical protein
MRRRRAHSAADEDALRVNVFVSAGVRAGGDGGECVQHLIDAVGMKDVFFGPVGGLRIFAGGDPFDDWSSAKCR